MSSSSSPEHMPWSALQWAGNELGVARIAALSKRLAVEQSQLSLQTSPMPSDTKERVQQLEKLFQIQQHVISSQKDCITAMQQWLQVQQLFCTGAEAWGIQKMEDLIQAQSRSICQQKECMELIHQMRQK